MKRVKIVLTSLTLALALTGVLVVKANEKKRTATNIGYFSTLSNGTTQITLSQSIFDDASVTNQATIKDNAGTEHEIFKNSNLTTDLKLIP